MARTRIGIYEIRNAAKKKAFAALFPEHDWLFQNYWKKPGCSECWRSLLAAISSDVEKITNYFGDVDIDLGDMPPPRREEMVAATTMVFNCKIDELQDQLDKLQAQNSGIKTFTIARWKDQVTVIANVIAIPAQQVHRVIHATIDEASDRITACDQEYPGQKQFSAARYEDQLTIIATSN